MKVNLHEAIFMERDVDVPDACPKCGASLTSDRTADAGLLDRGGNVVEVAWVDLLSYGRLEPLDPLGKIGATSEAGFYLHEHGDPGDASHTFELRCACGELLARAGTATLGKGEPVTGEALLRMYGEAREEA